jgi:hypothetical protein
VDFRERARIVENLAAIGCGHGRGLATPGRVRAKNPCEGANRGGWFGVADVGATGIRIEDKCTGGGGSTEKPHDACGSQPGRERFAPYDEDLGE